MDINVVNLPINNNNNTKSDTKPLKNNNMFNEVLAKSTKSQQESKPVKKDDVSPKDKFQVPEETKKALKDAGLSDKDIENIKSLKDMKNVLVEKIINDTPEDGVDINKLMLILAPFLNINIENLQELKGNIISGVEDALSVAIKTLDTKGENLTPEKIVQFLKSFEDKLGEVIDKNLSKPEDPIVKLLLSKEVISAVTEEINNNKLPISSEDIMAKVKQELKIVLNQGLKGMKDDNSNEKNLSELKGVDKELISNKHIFELAVTSKDDNSDKNYFSSKEETSKDDNFLKSLTNDGDKEDKISKATNFMAQFNNVNKDSKVTEVEKIMINKVTVNSDVIKAIKYMELNNIKDLTVKIAPKELGTVVINLTMEAGVMKATITTANKEAFNLLNSNLSDMTNKLQNSDMKINSLSLNIYNEDTTFFKDGSNKEGNHRQQKDRKLQSVESLGEETNELDKESLIDSSVNMLA